MALEVFNFTTGPATMVDVGVLSYNGCTFSPLFQSKVSGRVIKDNAYRTTKYMEYLIEVDGYVTMPDNEDDTNGVMTNLRTMLTAHAGQLIYSGRGMNMNINFVGRPVGANNGNAIDVAWGPVPELLEFQPLGAGRSAKVVWRVTVRIPEVVARAGGENLLVRVGGVPPVPLLQFNYESSVNYEESGYSSLSVKGTMEIPMTRRPDQATRTLTSTVDTFRSEVERRVLSGFDLSRFRITRRSFQVSRDKRTLEWEVTAEEKGYMDLPPDHPVARGTYSVRPARAGMGLVQWLCTLRATYIVRHDRPRRFAWFAFLLLLRRRMVESRHANIPKQGGAQNPAAKGAKLIIPFINPAIGLGIELYKRLLQAQDNTIKDGRKAWLIDFSFEEGVYLDSRTVTFCATWKIVTTFSHIMLASGLWTKVQETNARGENLWAISMRDVSGANSWLVNRLDPARDIIVDFGGG